MPDFARINISSYVGFSLAKASPTRIHIPRTRRVAMTTDYCHLREMGTVSGERWNERVTRLQCLCLLVGDQNTLETDHK